MYRVDLEGFEGQTIEVKPPSLFSGTKLLVNGQPAPKGPKRGQMALTSNDSREVIAAWQAKALGLDVPSLVVGDKTFNFVEPLKWYEWVWSALPLLLIFMGGAIGGFVGFLGFSINTKVFRSDQYTFAKFVLTAGVSAVSVVAYFILATIFFSLIGG